MQYHEIVYMKDGHEIARESIYDDETYDEDAPEPMSADDIEGWAL